MTFTKNPITKYKKIDGKWYRSRCQDCNAWVQSHKARYCTDCWLNHQSVIVIDGKPIKNYHHIHHWIKKELGKPTKCEDCGLEDANSRRFHWANISGNYLMITTDWRRLCASCHKRYDFNKRLGVK